MPRVVQIKCPPTKRTWERSTEVGSKSVNWLARLSQTFKGV